MTTTRQVVVVATSRVVGERDIAAVDHDQLCKLPGAHAAGSAAKEKGR